MKVICNNKEMSDMYYITFGKIYTAYNLDILSERYCIIDDIGKKLWYPKEAFIPIQEIRAKKLKRILK